MESFETRPYQADNAPITQQVTVSLDSDDGALSGDLTIEYKPRQSMLDGVASNDISEFEQPEEVLLALYKQLMGDLMPEYSSRDEPWTQAPLVLTFEYMKGWEFGTMTLGTMGQGAR